MAKQLTTSYTKVAEASLSRDGCNFSIKIYSKYSMSGSTATVTSKGTINCQSGFTWSGTNNYYRGWSDGLFDTGRTKRTNSVTSSEATLWERSYTITSSAEKTLNSKWEVYGGTYSNTAAVAVYVPSSAFSTPPAAPTISASAASASQINVTWGTTNLGNPTGTAYLYNGTSSSPSTQISSKTTTGDSTYNNTGLTANTAYYYKATASNTAGSASSSVVNATTYPAGISSITGGSLTTSSIVLTLVFASSGSALTTTAQVSSNNTNWNNTSLTNVQGTTQTYSVTGLNANTQYTRYFRVNTTVGNSAVKSFTWTTKPANITSATATSISETAATVAVACGTSGSAATTDLQVSSDNVNWTTVANNVQGTTVDVSLTGLTPNTSVTRYFRVHTVYGDTPTVTVTFTTLKVAHFYGSVNGSSKRIKKLYGSVNGQTKTIKKVYASVNGQTKLIYRG